MRPRVVVFYGGDAEHSASSKESGKWLCQYIPKSAYDVTPVHVTHEGNWKVPIGSLPKIGDIGRAMDMLAEATPALAPKDALNRLFHKNVDSLVTLMRGRGGDDGAMHHVAETLHIPVAGSPAYVNTIAYNKHHLAHAISDIAPTPYSELIPKGTSVEEIAGLLRSSFTVPFFIKPVHGAGSHGVIHIKSAEDIASAAQNIHAQHKDMLAQEQRHGMELSVTLFQDAHKKIHILPTSIVTPKGSSFFDYHAKLRTNGAGFHHNHDSHQHIIDQAEGIARDVYEKLACEGVVSVDMISDNGALDVLDVNTIPTFTGSTPIIHQLRHAGMHPEQFITNGFL